MKGYQTARAVRARGAFFYDLHHGRTMTKGGGGGGGGGGYSELSGMIEWGQKSKSKKIPGKKINPQKMPCRICAP